MQSAFGVEHDNIEKGFGSAVRGFFKPAKMAGKHVGPAGPGSGLAGKRKAAGAHKGGRGTDKPSLALGYAGAGKRSKGYLGRHAAPGLPGKRMKRN